MDTPPDLELLLDFVNTLDVESCADALPEFLTDARVSRYGLTEPGPAVELRESLRAVCLAHSGVEVPAAELAALDGVLEAAPLVVRIDAAGAAVLEPAPGLTGLAAFTARLAAIVAAAAAEGTWQRVKACEARTCRWAYYDRSPAGRRRWCDMSVCGSRAKMRAYREARKSG
ncbi:CGNR zinc finger domain-containing protein [Streptomyces sp. NPDC051940]|uniref:CGNR zinc finger domain-containing protein n=1 Tax=Streptomyces sp. NPDC051940 TaxID=3155675 RepID=UPI00342CB05C